MASRLLRTIYDSLGHTGENYYAKFVRKISGRIWDNVAEELANNPTWEDASVALTETGTHGAFDVLSPENLPAGNYDVIVYKRAGSVPQDSDDVELQFNVSIGGIFGF